MSRYRAITVHQPWAWAICAGLKRVENRTWITNYRGPVAIHAGTNRDRLNAFLQRVESRTADWPSVPTGVVVDVAELTDVVPL